MKRLNKNGFAISTMLYGLLIIMVLLMSLLMSTMSFSRSNSKKFVKNVIDSLEYRDLTPPKITLGNLSSRKLYAGVQYTLTFQLKVTEENILKEDTSKKIEISVNGQVISSTSELSFLKKENSDYIYNYQVSFNSTKTGTLNIKIPEGKFYDNYYNRNVYASIATSYTLQIDKDPPQIALDGITKEKEEGYYKFSASIRVYDPSVVNLNSGISNPITVQVGKTKNTNLYPSLSETGSGDDFKMYKIKHIRIPLNGEYEGDVYLCFQGGLFYDKYNNSTSNVCINTKQSITNKGNIKIKVNDFDKYNNTGFNFSINVCNNKSDEISGFPDYIEDKVKNKNYYQVFDSSDKDINERCDVRFQSCKKNAGTDCITCKYYIPCGSNAIGSIKISEGLFYVQNSNRSNESTVLTFN